tara:strand:+ start:90 stop:635 length:546 start_codon:yes stop_codon:yes gene_type:complete
VAISKIRIIAGKWRGRKLDVINLPALRPTPDRVRETLFNWLQEDIVGACCLDLFAGTGVLGFEALSRGAGAVFMIESNPKIVESLKHHAEMLGSKSHTIKLADAMSWVRQSINKFDIIFLDPPFGKGYLEPCLEAISEEMLLKPKGLVYVESEKKLVLPSDWKITKETKISNVESMLVEPI